MTHLKTLKWLNFVMGAYTFIGGLFWLFLFLLPWLIGDDPEVPVGLIVLFGILGFIVFAAYGAAHVVIGYLVGTGRGRIAQTVFAILQLMSFPIGTCYAGYAVWVCWINEESARAFASGIKPGVV